MRKGVGAIFAACVLLFILFASACEAYTKEKKSVITTGKQVHGGFEMNIFLDTIAGFQHLSNDPVTELASDGSTGGVLGEYVPSATIGPVPSPGETLFGVYIPKFELDMVKHIGDRARLRADISFGRPGSGSYVNGVLLSHAYAAVRLSRDYNIELVIGRFGMQSGYEPFRSWHNDTVSWSILWRGPLYPPAATGLQLSANLTDTFSLFFTVSNGNIVDSLSKDNTLPAFLTTLEWTWGNEARPNQVVITPYIGPEDGGNKPLTYGADATIVYWFGNRWKLGLEGSFLRDAGANANGPSTSYFGSLFNLRFEINPAWYGVVKFVFARQFGPGKGIIDNNYTGAEQNIYESSLGFGYQLNDAAKIKTEFRFDVIDPTHSSVQTIPGAAISYTWFL